MEGVRRQVPAVVRVGVLLHVHTLLHVAVSLQGPQGHVLLLLLQGEGGRGGVLGEGLLAILVLPTLHVLRGRQMVSLLLHSTKPHSISIKTYVI